ncbi:MAG: TIGR03086 family metal-binding protein [Acidimicrobiia bacterium]
MSHVGDRYRRVAGRFTERVREVPPGGWERPAPCEGWVARDVVRHLVEWFPPFLRRGAGIEVPTGPSVEDDPVGAWTTMSDAVQALLDAPDVPTRRFSHPQAGDHPLDQAIAMFFLGDVLVHTWDLARAAGLDETLDPDEVAGMLAGLEPMDEVLRASGHYGPRVEVGDNADTQTRLIAFTGRHP